MIIKLTKPYIIEGEIFEAGAELVISSDGENEILVEPKTEPEKEINFDLVKDEDKTVVKQEELPLE